MKLLHTLIVSALLLTACGRHTTPGVITPVPTVTQQPTLVPDAPVNAVNVNWSIGAPVVGKSLKAGSTAQVALYLTPSILQVTRLADGTIQKTEISNWTNHPVTNMRFCISVGSACKDPGDLQPYADGASVPLNLDWLGQQQVYLSVQFTDKDGNPVNATEYSSTYGLTNGVLVLHQSVTTAVDPADKNSTLPSPIQTYVAATQSAFPVTGSIKIENSPCCKGGPAGKPVKVKVNFQASSPFGKVTDMRLGTTCPYNDSNVNGEWEPYVEEKTYTAGVPLNWSSFVLNVQFRDEKGNLSQVFCDSLGIEGSPEQPK